MTEGVEIVVDAAGLSRVMSNLLINAIRHTPADGVVEVSGAPYDDSTILLSVSDSCGGLSTEEMERAFDMGWQRNHARTPTHDALAHGAGLGLAVVKGIVEAHKGRVFVENLDQRAGCRFSVLLPA